MAAPRERRNRDEEGVGGSWTEALTGKSAKSHCFRLTRAVTALSFPHTPSPVALMGNVSAVTTIWVALAK